MKIQFLPSTQMLELAVSGNLLSTNAGRFRVEATEAMDVQSSGTAPWLGVQIDLTDAHMVDSAGLNAIISVIRKLKADGKRALIHVRDPHVYKVCMFTRLDSLAEIVQC